MIQEIGIKQKEIFNKASTHPLQSWEWGEFRKAWGNEVIYTKYGLITIHRIPFTGHKLGMFIKGPRPTKVMLSELKTEGIKHNVIFIKIESNFVPENEITKNELTKLLRDSGCVPGKTLFTPTTFWIDLTPPEEDIFKKFSSKTRYNIRLAQRNGVVAEENNSEKAFKKYLKLTRETVERQGFYAHTEKYHKLMWKVLHPAGVARLLVAKYRGEIITTWILFVWKDFLYYPYGASTEKYKNIMANNLIMWEAIRFGKKLGLKTFDLWGREPGKGFTRFKEGYNPKVVELLGTWDLVINKPLYTIYRLAEKIRWPVLRLKSKLAKPTF